MLAIYSKMSAGYVLSPQIIKNTDVTNKEYATVSENLSALPGVDITTDWERNYVFKEANSNDSVLGSILGDVTTEKKACLPIRNSTTRPADTAAMTASGKVTLNSSMKMS